MRRYMATKTQGRVLIGGKRTGFQGEIPGLVEEALISLEQDHPVYLAGGFGGVTADIVQALGVDDGSWLPPLADARPPDPRWESRAGAPPGFSRRARRAERPPQRLDPRRELPPRRLASTERDRHAPKPWAWSTSCGRRGFVTHAGACATRL